MGRVTSGGGRGALGAMNFTSANFQCPVWGFWLLQRDQWDLPGSSSTQCYLFLSQLCRGGMVLMIIVPQGKRWVSRDAHLRKIPSFQAEILGFVQVQPMPGAG